MCTQPTLNHHSSSRAAVFCFVSIHIESTQGFGNGSREVSAFRVSYQFREHVYTGSALEKYIWPKIMHMPFPTHELALENVNTSYFRQGVYIVFERKSRVM